ncbi:D-beta-hydroxybutyrate dehydrogenase [Mycobacteroides franklinii]|uniref:3-oxoacyl-[acyl-carrier-protein] reductase MabA n=2 Tax=Mycobacteroides franklinii TaxID=948102 RepID=A0A4R8R9E2_9MYCO|nr:D-beta-hydroxybutyrate dehydrogenase [Mycobacteroides franklinii]TDZ52885.1 D-beta-hydroxybutyrate dehydrogenase [Mycobacteroides franklinii]TDZ56292.1 D-beta-hydroxybutyrate dehydrogenase [Mycobacteroides franklinii]TDZ63233.1 D-beta-hydroxybutyrate dehydrogenase [Mycobacteroides franklinii]TDZ69630.1 D-beta-hydroxybutyrate dehydrogenase [Mycobacteroides franklinii]
MGEATARVFAADGAFVAVTDLRLEDAQAVADAIGDSAVPWALDVTNDAQISEVVAAVGERFGRLDIVVNNAGFAAFRSLDDPDYGDTWDRSLAVHLTAPVRVVRAALPFLRNSPAPRVVNIASTEALGATPYDSPYVAAKSGLAGLTRSLAVDLGRDGITVNCICPGPIDTAMTAAIPAEDKDTYARRRTALRRYGRAEEVAHVTLSVCLPAASYLTGAVIPVDGGLMARNA